MKLPPPVRPADGQPISGGDARPSELPRATSPPAWPAASTVHPSYGRVLPSAAISPPQAYFAPSEAESARATRTQPSAAPRLLVLEDNVDSGELLKTLLDDQYQVTLRNTYDAALDALSRERFDLLVLDINLGETRTGADLLRAVRRMPSHGQTPAIACTAYATSDERGQSWYEDAGFNGYVRKPFEIDELFDTIERVLRRHRR